LVFSLAVAIFVEPQNGHAVGAGNGSELVIMRRRLSLARSRQDLDSPACRDRRAMIASAGGGASSVCDLSEIARDRRFA